MDLAKELDDIRNLISSACFIEAVRKEMNDVFKDSKPMVIGGKYARKHLNKSSDYDIVVIHKGNKEQSKVAARRIKSRLPDVQIKQLNGIIDNVIGIRTSRRNKLKK